MPPPLPLANPTRGYYCWRSALPLQTLGGDCVTLRAICSLSSVSLFAVSSSSLLFFFFLHFSFPFLFLAFFLSPFSFPFFFVLQFSFFLFISTLFSIPSFPQHQIPFLVSSCYFVSFSPLYLLFPSFSLFSSPSPSLPLPLPLSFSPSPNLPVASFHRYQSTI